MNEKRIRLEEVASTNDYAKARRADGQNLLITAKRQTGGRGTKGRSFVSQKGGVYLTRLRFYEDFPAEGAFSIMVGAAVAVCKTLEGYGLVPVIKWPNDIYVNERKICGMLIENTLSGGRISSSVVGIGLNVRNPLPQELADIAIAMSEVCTKPPSVEEVTERLIVELSKSHTLEEYRERLGFVGRRVDLLFTDERIPATLLSVTDRGELEVETDGRRQYVSAGEVSLRI